MTNKNVIKPVNNSHLYIPLISGAMAGMCVDLTLFPIDTIKTRIQSSAGFWKSGGFRHIYSGVGTVVVGSGGGALFFGAYECSKSVLKPLMAEKYEPFSHMLSAAFGEVTQCLLKVPVEVVKQRAQTSNASSSAVLAATVRRDGFGGLYRGYMSTIVREIPFAFIQFPVWEYLKKKWSTYQGMPLNPFQSTVCGATAGAVAALTTTPLDLAKTRIMLAEKGTVFSFKDILRVLKEVYKQNGVFGLFSGALPRVVYISIGGAIFLGGYDIFTTLLTNRVNKNH